MKLPERQEIRSWISKKCFPNRPNGATINEWSDIHRTEKQEHPLLYWFDQTFMTYLAVKKMQLNAIKYWFLYRLVAKHKYHLVNTGLKPDYYENDKRMLHANFNILKEYVEIEKAHLQYTFRDEPKTTSPADAGLAYLKWESKLRYSADELPTDDSRVGKLTSQAIDAGEIQKLYLWWVSERTARPDPYEIFPRTYDATEDDDDGWMEQWANRSDSDQIASSERFASIRKLESKYEAEDTNMLIRLMRIRKCMWS